MSGGYIEKRSDELEKVFRRLVRIGWLRRYIEGRCMIDWRGDFRQQGERWRGCVMGKSHC